MGQQNGRAQAGGQDRLREWAAGAAEFARQRLAGEFQTDESGFDPHFHAHVIMPLTRALYRNWFRVEMRGVEHVPDEGAALVVANHSGVLPFDAIMLQIGLLDAHAQHRNLRLLGADLVFADPRAGRAWRSRAATPWPNPAEAERLLAAGELVGVFPEGFKGIGKLFRERYQLQRFGRGGFAAAAMRTRRADRALRDRRRRGDLPDDRELPSRWPGCSACRTSRSRRCSRGSARSALIPLPSNWIIEFGAPVPHRRAGPVGGRPDARVRPDRPGTARPSSRRCYTLLDERRSVFF